MNSPDLLATALQLQQQGQPYALVTVLRVVAPASARPGDKAVVDADGIRQGWIGGGCAQPAVQRTVRLALADGRARVIRIAPAEEGHQRELDDVLEFGMACHSGGTLELFVDPMLPQARLTVVGDSPLAVALAGLAPRVGLPVTVVAHGADAARFVGADRVLTRDEAAADVAALVAPGSFVVVATQGRRDIQGLRLALALQARQVFFVASARKAQVLKDALVAAGHDAVAVGAIVAPAGQPIGAQTPEEIALSVLAAVVAARRGGTGVESGGTAAAPVDGTAAAAAGAGAGGAADRAADRAAGGSGAVENLAASASAKSAAPAVAAATATVPARTPRPAPLPDLPPIMGSCCGGGAEAAVAPTMAATAPAATAAAADPATVATTAATPDAARPTPPSCCGG
jgi:xanthine dehydrogenase accessory factor